MEEESSPTLAVSIHLKAIGPSIIAFWPTSLHSLDVSFLSLPIVVEAFTPILVLAISV